LSHIQSAYDKIYFFPVGYFAYFPDCPYRARLTFPHKIANFSFGETLKLGTDPHDGFEPMFCDNLDVSDLHNKAL
jgi:hypothetical protein